MNKVYNYSLLERFKKLNLTSTNEKFSLQEYEGRIRDIIFDDVSDLNKISTLVCVFLLKYHLFILSRDIIYKDLKCNISLILYNENDGKDNVVKSSNKSNLNIQYGPDEVEGIAAGNNISLYVPINVGETAPYISTSLNRNFIDFIKSNKGLLNGLKRNDCWIKALNFESIDDSVKYLKDKYNEKILELKQIEKPNSNIRKDLGINKAYILQTLKHELTHILDNKNGSKDVNRFSAINSTVRDGVNKYALEAAANILYMLWSRTEFNAFTQTFSDSSGNKRELVRKDRIEKVLSKYLSRPLKSGGYETIDHALNETRNDLDWLENEFGNDPLLWEAIKDICIAGSYESSVKERFEKLNWRQFKNYFIRTTEKLMKKLKDKTIKNSASQADYNRDIINLASDIRDSVENSNIDENNVVSFRFNYIQFFRKLNEPHKVYVEVEAVSSNNDMAIAVNSMLRIVIADLNKKYEESARNLFGSNYESFTNLIKEVAGKNRKSYINKFCLEFAEDLYSVLNRLEK